MKQLHGRALDEGETEGASVLIDEDRREMIISGTVDGAMFNTVCYGLGMLEAKKGPITVYINTCGGSGYDGVGIYDRLRLCKNEIVGIAVGACMSAGMAILMGCDARLSTPECRFMVHEAQNSLPEMSTGRLGHHLDEAKALDAAYQRILQTKNGLTDDEIKVLCSKDTFMSAEQVMAYGLIDGILDPGLLPKNKVRKTKNTKKRSRYNVK